MLQPNYMQFHLWLGCVATGTFKGGDTLKGNNFSLFGVYLVV
jgi:hypothetical protein